ncbi:methionine gamma-lyase family protein [Alkalibacter rhizosphaerae]|uniref:Methionine gamma-lyase family protein n=1 Tax=Alkalibacter rhizosphaerae TaxID=2815577 RepID=A0A974XN20_9FIRM|nr:methionine gamma-lyase family protein [Alkalibacter rhizosphaerae]QSX08896.1 methionine gamma-lyase family protein [Alkalibacter rhizosphaerae]
MIKELDMKRFGIDEEIVTFCSKAEKALERLWEEIKDTTSYNQFKVIDAMRKNRLSDRHFAVSTGYGYNDEGRDILERIFADIMGAEDALVRPQIISGTHAIALCLYGVLRPGDKLLAITGSPYDTVATFIGMNKNESVEGGTLREFGVEYEQIDLEGDGIQVDKVLEAMDEKTKMVYLQRSTGYGWRKAVTITELESVIGAIKDKDPNVVIMVDNCYGEFIERKEPTEVGADLMAGSLIKNPGGGIAPMGGYVAGRADLVYLAACRLAAPGIARETGATMGINRIYLQGLFLAPTVVSQALKTAILAAKVFSELGYDVCPKHDDSRSDIIQAIRFGTPEKVELFCQAIQGAAPVDSYVVPQPWEMPGYHEKVIMAAGAFVQGSSIELSADAPMREPFIGYLQGGLTHEHGKFGIYSVLQLFKEKGILRMPT